MSEENTRKHISYSEWGSWRNGCQHRWYLDYRLKKRQKSYSVHMDFGTAIHETIELMKNTGRPSDHPDLLTFFEQSFITLLFMNGTKYREKERKDLAKNGFSFFMNAGQNIISHFDKCAEISGEGIEVLYNEHRLELPIDRNDGIEIDFKGFIDMVIITKDARGNTILYICDFKTCSWGWDREKRSDKELHFQILLYKHFLCKKFDIDPKLTRVAFVLLKKRPPKGTPPIEFFPISAGPVSVQRALDEINRDITDMAKAERLGDFKKNREVCTSSFGDVCPYLHTADCPD